MVNKRKKSFADPEIAAIFKAYPPKARTMLMEIRELIFAVASKSEWVGSVDEVLKWGEPSYVTSETKSGSTIRIDWKSKDPDHVAIYFKCTADLVPAMRKRFKDGPFQFSSNRAILFKKGSKIPKEELMRCVALALTYHKNKKLSQPKRWAMVEDILAT